MSADRKPVTPAEPDTSAYAPEIRSEKLLGVPALTAGECAKVLAAPAVSIAGLVGFVAWVVQS